MQSPPKPYELNRSNQLANRSRVAGITTNSVASNSMPRIPPRTYSSMDSYSQYGGGMNRFGSGYGGYGSSYGSSFGGGYGGYGSRYGGFGGSYGGYGSRYGGGYGGYGGYGDRFGDGYGPMPPEEEGWSASFLRFLHGFGSFSRVLDATSYSMQDSFHTITQFTRTYGELRNTLGYGMRAITLFAFLQVAWRKIKRYVMGPDNDVAWNSSNLTDNNVKATTSSGLSWSNIAIIMGIIVYILPWFWAKLKRWMYGDQAEADSKFVALYDFQAETQDEISFRVGDIIQVSEKNGLEWWRGTVHGKKGYFPANYVEQYISNQDKKKKSKKKSKDKSSGEDDLSTSQNGGSQTDKNHLKIVPLHQRSKSLTSSSLHAPRSSQRSKSIGSVPRRRNYTDEDVEYMEEEGDYIEDEYYDDEDVEYLPHRSINLNNRSSRRLPRRVSSNPPRENNLQSSRPSYLRSTGLRN